MRRLHPVPETSQKAQTPSLESSSMEASSSEEEDTGTSNHDASNVTSGSAGTDPWSETEESGRGEGPTHGPGTASACFDRLSFKWVYPANGNVARGTDLGDGDDDDDDDALVECNERQRARGTASPFIDISEEAPREKRGYNAFKSIKQVAGLPRSEKDSASWLREHIASESSGMTCLLCNQSRREVLMVPCYHLSLCKSCSADYPSIPCPLCKVAATSRIEIQL